ncbi:MAG: hypothetical protein ABJA82_04260 [Myxococcales bacterium]
MSTNTTRGTSAFSLVVRLTLVVAALGSWAVVSACSSSGGKRPEDAGTKDSFSIDYHFGDLPPGCPPAAGNDKQVGTPCSKTAPKTQCGGDLVCACQVFNGVVPPDDTPCFCTLPIPGKLCSMVSPGTCGQGATCCSYKTAGSICVPDACLAEMGCPVF